VRRKGPKWLMTETKLYPLAALPVAPSTPQIVVLFDFDEKASYCLINVGIRNVKSPITLC